MWENDLPEFPAMMLIGTNESLDVVQRPVMRGGATTTARGGDRESTVAGSRIPFSVTRD